MHSENLAGLLVAVCILGIGAQWIAWRLNLPSILLLLLVGLLAGPFLGFLNPDALFGDLLLPGVNLAVALILYEGGLSLRLREIGAVKAAVRNLVTVGALVAGVTGGLAAWSILDVSPAFAALIGSLFIVTGPTVIGPLLMQVRPEGSVGPILRWEGIVTDPIGAMAAVVIYEVMIGHGHGLVSTTPVVAAVKTLGIGSAIGAVGAFLLWRCLRRHLVPDALQNPFSLMLVLMVFASGNMLQSEAGLVGVTLMGILLANQKTATIRHLVEFKENLRALLLAVVFVTLAARVEMSALRSLELRHFLFVGSLILVVRPLSVFVSTWRSGLSRNEKLFLCCMAPRGIVAAAVASVLGLGLIEHGHAEAEMLVPLTILVIVVTVALYGLTAGRAAKWLGLSSPERGGYLILGGHRWAVDLALILDKLGTRVVMVDANPEHVRQARLRGLQVYRGDILAEHAIEELDLSGIGRFLAITRNEDVNSLACLHLSEIFGRSEVFQLAKSARDEERSDEIGGRRLFRSDATFAALQQQFDRGATLRVTPLTEEFTLKDYVEHHGESSWPLFRVDAKGRALPVTQDLHWNAQPGDHVVALVEPTHDPASEAASPTTRTPQHIAHANDETHPVC